MKRLLVASSIGLGLACGSTFAADLPVTTAPSVIPVTAAPGFTAPAPPPAVYTWTGCYVNGGAGYGMWKQDHYGEELAPLTQSTPTVSTGGEFWVGTIVAGCDYQVGSRWLIGAFGDYNLMNVTFGGTFQEPSLGWIGNETTEQAWALGGRIGYLRHPQTADLHQRRLHPGPLRSNKSFGRPTCTSASRLRSGPCSILAHSDGGWFLGGGTEYSLWIFFSPWPVLADRLSVRPIQQCRSSHSDLHGGAGNGGDVHCRLWRAYAEGCTDRYHRVGLALRRRRASIRISLRGRYIRESRAGHWGGGPRPPSRPPVYTWTGCYINGGAGYGMWEQDNIPIAAQSPAASVAEAGSAR